MGQWVNGWVRPNYYQFNKSLHNQDNSILFEDLSFVEIPPPLGGCMGSLVDGWFSGSMGGARSYY